MADDSGRPVGVLTLGAVRGTAPDRVRVREVMRSLDDVRKLDADAPASGVMDALAHGGVVLVEDGGEPLRVVTPRSLLALLRRHEELEAALRARR